MSYLDLVRDAVDDLAVDPEEQIRRLDADGGSHGECTDELGLSFEDVTLAIKHHISTGEITRDLAVVLQRIDRALEIISGQENAELWTYDALRSAPEWAQIRRMARQAQTDFPDQLAPHDFHSRLEKMRKYTQGPMRDGEPRRSTFAAFRRFFFPGP